MHLCLTYKKRWCMWFNLRSMQKCWEIGEHGQTREVRCEDAVCVPCVWSEVRAQAVCVVLQGLVAALGQVWLPELRFTVLWLLPAKGEEASRTEGPLNAKSRCW